MFAALEQLPLHITCATCFSPVSAATPIISPIFAATAAPPTGHALTGASPFTIAAATPPQPGYPQPPQFAPGSTSSILASLSSTSTANFCAAKANTAPNINPMIPNNITAFNISTILHPLFL